MKIKDYIVFIFSDRADKFEEVSQALFSFKDNNFIQIWVSFYLSDSYPTPKGSRSILPLLMHHLD